MRKIIAALFAALMLAATAAPAFAGGGPETPPDPMIKTCAPYTDPLNEMLDSQVDTVNNLLRVVIEQRDTISAQRVKIIDQQEKIRRLRAELRRRAFSLNAANRPSGQSTLGERR